VKTRPGPEGPEEAAAARAELSARGFAILPGLLDVGELRQLRARIVDVMYRHGWIAGADDTSPGPRAQRDGGDGWWQGYTAIQRIEALHRLGHDPHLLQWMRDTFSADVLSHNRRIVGVTLPGYGVPAHQDFVSVQGSADTLTVWVPLDDRDRESAAIRLLPVGTGAGLRPLEWLDGISAGIATDPGEAWEQPRVRVGDVVVYHGLTVHELLPNRDSRYRIACELRFQPLQDPVCGASLNPHHYPRVPGWPSLTNGWHSDCWVAVPEGVTLAPFQMPRRMERWHAELAVPPASLLGAGDRYQDAGAGAVS
jgi:phytanoyl-CoA dioxygenase PhyH